MTIISREKVRAAYLRALVLQNDHESAVLAAAQALALPEDIVREVVEC